MKYCKPKTVKKKRRLNIAVSEEIWDRFVPALEREWGDSFTSWVEFAMECYSRTACEGCPYNRDDMPKSRGIGKRDLKSK